MTMLPTTNNVCVSWECADGGKNQHPPEWFDNFGIVCFGVLGYVGYKMLRKEKVPSWAGFAILLIAVLGLIVDGYIVLKLGGL